MTDLPDNTPLTNRLPEPELMDLTDEADAYARADFAEVNAQFVNRLLEVIPLESATAVDLGTGPADIPIRIATQRPGWHVTAVDASAAMLQHARQAVASRNLYTQIDIVLADAKATKLNDHVFDVVLSNSILHHITDTAELWNEVRRLVKPDGYVFLRDLCRPATAGDAATIVATHAGMESSLLQEEFYRSLLSAYTVREVQDQLRHAGMHGLQVEQITDRHLDIYGRLAP